MVARTFAMVLESRYEALIPQLVEVITAIVI